MMLSLHHYEALKAGEIKHPNGWEDFRCELEPMTGGPWSIERFTVELGMTNLRLMRDGRGCIPGEYTRLIHPEYGMVMSDTTAEFLDHRKAILRADGRCLLHGLGLGCVLKAMLAYPGVTHIDVVEIDQELIDLVGPHFQSERVTIHHGDALVFKWPPNQFWTVVWHDIWNEVCSDNLPQMHQLHRKFGSRCFWQGSWGAS